MQVTQNAKSFTIKSKIMCRHPLKLILEKYQFILASASPRRKSLLADLDIEFDVRTVHVDESYPQDLDKQRVAVYIAQKKANAQAHLIQERELLLTSDTVVLLDNQILGKPLDALEAKKMLEALSGSAHRVITGVCLKSLTKEVVFSGITTVSFRKLTAEEIDYYIACYKPYDKAGAYGIQEWIGMIGIQAIDGCFFNVMGLPLQKLYHHLKLHF